MSAEENGATAAEPLIALEGPAVLGVPRFGALSCADERPVVRVGPRCCVARYGIPTVVGLDTSPRTQL